MKAKVVTSFVAHEASTGEEFEVYDSDTLSIIAHDDGGFSFNLHGDDVIDSNVIYVYKGCPVTLLCDLIPNDEVKAFSTEFIKPKIDVKDIKIDDLELLI